VDLHSVLVLVDAVDDPVGPAPRGDSPVEYPDYDSDEEQQPEPFDLKAVNRRLAVQGSSQP
jgi:hypothetical protein